MLQRLESLFYLLVQVAGKFIVSPACRPPPPAAVGTQLDGRGRLVALIELVNVYAELVEDTYVGKLKH
jgi:hypothetical protein